MKIEEYLKKFNNKITEEKLLEKIIEYYNDGTMWFKNEITLTLEKLLEKNNPNKINPNN